MSIRPTTKHDIQRDEENITRPNFDVITNIQVSGSIGMLYTGVDQGTGQVTLYVSGTIPYGLAGGDLTGSYPNPSVFQSHFTDQVAPSSVPTGTLILESFNQQGFSVPHVYDVQGNAIEITRDNMFVVRNVSGNPMTRGQVVFITGSTGQVPQVQLAKADSLQTLNSISVLYDNIANNGYGRSMFLGDIEHIDMSAFGQGNILYVSPAVAGGLTATKPTYPNYAEVVGVVLNNGVGNGILQVYTRKASQRVSSLNNGILLGETDSFNYVGPLTATISGTMSQISYFSNTAIEGLQIDWINTGTIGVEAGSCFAPNGDWINFTGTVNISPTLTAGAWHNVYVFVTGSVATVEVNTTAVTPWRGTAYGKSGDTSRRYIGSILTNTAKNIREFDHHELSNLMTWSGENALGAAPFRALNGGAQASATAVSMTGAIPPHSVSVCSIKNF